MLSLCRRHHADRSRSFAHFYRDTLVFVFCSAIFHVNDHFTVQHLRVLHNLAAFEDRRIELAIFAKDFLNLSACILGGPVLYDIMDFLYMFPALVRGIVLFLLAQVRASDSLCKHAPV